MISFFQYIGKFGSMRTNPNLTTGQNVLSRIYWIISLSRNAVIVIFGTALAFIFSTYGQTPFKLTGNAFFQTLFSVLLIFFYISGNVGTGLPPLQLPPFSTVFNGTSYGFDDMAKQLGTSIIFMPLVAILESIAITKAFCKY